MSRSGRFFREELADAGELHADAEKFDGGFSDTGGLVTGTLSEKHSLGAGRIEHTPLRTNDYETDSNGKKIVFKKFGEPVVYYGSIGSVDFTQYKKLVLEIK